MMHRLLASWKTLDWGRVGERLALLLSAIAIGGGLWILWSIGWLVALEVVGAWLLIAVGFPILWALTGSHDL